MFLFLNAHKCRGELNHGTRTEQINSFQYPGDAKMREFYEHWIELVEDLDASLPDETLRRLLREKLDSSEELKIDLSHFDRLAETDPLWCHATVGLHGNMYETQGGPQEREVVR